MAWISVPLSLVWLANGFWLGRRQERLAAATAPGAADAAAYEPHVLH